MYHFLVAVDSADERCVPDNPSLNIALREFTSTPFIEALNQYSAERGRTVADSACVDILNRPYISKRLVDRIGSEQTRSQIENSASAYDAWEVAHNIGKEIK